MIKLKRLGSNLRSSLEFLRLLVRRATWRHLQVLSAVLSGFIWGSALTTPVMAQGVAAGPQNLPAPQKEELSLAPAKVAVQPIAHDEEIRKRLQSVMDATGWFIAPQVRVVDGVVFLSGRAESDEVKKWAGDLARNTQDVVAVANRIEVSQPSAWDFRGARSGLSGLSRDFIRSLPFLVVALFILKEAETLKSSGELPRSEGLDAVSTKAEAGLSNEAGILEEQARQAKPVDERENLLGATNSIRPAKAGLTADNKN